MLCRKDWISSKPRDHRDTRACEVEMNFFISATSASLSCPSHPSLVPWPNSMPTPNESRSAVADTVVYLAATGVVGCEGICRSCSKSRYLDGVNVFKDE